MGPKKPQRGVQSVVGTRQVYEDDYTRGEAADRAQGTGMTGYGSGLIKTPNTTIPGAPDLPKPTLKRARAGR